MTKRTLGMATLATAIAAALLFGCGGGNDESASAPSLGEAAQDAAEATGDAVRDAAQGVADAAQNAAEEAEMSVEEMKEMVEAAAAKMGEEGGGSAVETCLDHADRSDWAGALESCTQAAKDRPDDLKIRHALQQATAAAAQGS